MSIFGKYVEKFQGSLKSDKNKCNFTWRPKYNFNHISLFSSQNEKYLELSCRETGDTHFGFSNCFFFENRAIYEIMWENVVERGRLQMATWRLRIACWIP